MAAAPISGSAPAAADEEIVYESMSIRIYKNRVERYVNDKYVAASTDAATGVTSRDHTISPNTFARLYLPCLDGDTPLGKLPVLVYYHGGGFCLGSAFDCTYHTYFNNFVALANIVVVSVEYRLAPEHPVPAAYVDSWEALVWVVSHINDGAGNEPWLTDHVDFSRLYLGGESAGANIAHHMVMRVGVEGLAHNANIRGLVMIHPYFLGSNKVNSDELDLAARERLGRLWPAVCLTTKGEDDPLINPFIDSAPSLDALACMRVLVCIGEADVLRDRGSAYYNQLKGSVWRGEVEIWQAPDKGHRFHLLEPGCDEAVAQNKVINGFVNH